MPAVTVEIGNGLSRTDNASFDSLRSGWGSFYTSSGEPVTIKKMIDKVRNYTGTGKPRFGEVLYRSGENMVLYDNIEKSETYLRYMATTSLDDDLKKTIDWFTNAKI